MSAHIRRSVASLFSKSPSPMCKSHVRFWLSLCYFASSTETHPVSTPTFNLHKYHFSPQAASVLARLKNPERSDSVLSFLQESGFSNAQLEKIVKCKPELLCANIENIIKPKIKIFHDLGFSAHEVAGIISSNPVIFSRSIRNRIIPSLSVLKGLVGSNAEVAKLIRKNSWFLITDLEKTMVPNIEFLKSCGIPVNQITRYTCFFPRFILHKPEIMRKAVDKADEMGVSRSSNVFIYAVGVVSSMSNEILELKFKTFREFGFSEDEILGMFRKAPQVFSVSEEKINNVIELLLATGRYSTLCIARFPNSLMYSIETRYKPRLHALETLEKKNLIENWPMCASRSMRLDSLDNSSDLAMAGLSSCQPEQSSKPI
ncbi:hypothetical protein DH2020_035117 [Rehmannia glutinosa]|uniref:Uncharacterized protein n=1 Tax=Rehmannia glutinosa TaxID=99300 RepID=A0ABR0V7D6_REHGL